MEIGVIFPQTEIEADPGAIRDFAQAAEDLGYDHIFIADHVLGADPSYHQHPSLGTYNHKSVVHESLVVMGFLSAITERVGLTSGILILPQRQTALVAKQAAEIDVLSGGRLRLGIGVGWNAVEFEALNEDFHNRGRRSAEQIEVMRALWTQEVVDYHGRWHDITHAGINPLPVQRPIPVWIGGGSSGDAKAVGGGAAAHRGHSRRLVPEHNHRRRGPGHGGEGPRLRQGSGPRPVNPGPRRAHPRRRQAAGGVAGRGKSLGGNGRHPRLH